MKKKFLFLLTVLLVSCHLFAQQAGRSVWPAVKKEMHPWTRWWWMGSAVDKPNLDKVLTAYKEAGIGGVEITPIYGAKGYENRYISFLSPQWMSMLDFTVQKASSLGMGVDMNTGTGWPFGGPQITNGMGAGKIIVSQSAITAAGQRLSLHLTTGDTIQQRLGAPLQAVTAINEKGDRISLMDKVQPGQQLEWTPDAGKWTIYAAFSGKTGQQVKRAAPGGEGNVMDHYTKAPVQTYLKRFTDAFHSKPPGIDAFFNDSYEVYLANWSPELFETFRRLKGYDLRLYIKELGGSDSSDLTARIKCDYNEVLGQMLLENFTKPWTSWAHRQNAKAKNQAHGSPGNILDLYSAADIPECEAYFGLSQFQIPGLKHDTADVRDSTTHNPVVFKFASSAAHFYDKPLVSSETFVWQTEHFRTAFSECKPEVEQLFLAGVNHVYFHGATYSPQDVAWPGWLFYASANFVPANSTWPHLYAMNEYITRCQSVLQAGKADNDILVYWPVYDQWSDAAGMEKRFSMHTVEDWLFPTDFNKTVTELLEAGYSMDFVSDNMLHDALTGTGKLSLTEKVLIIPQCRYMPLETLQTISGLAKKGMTIIFKSLPGDVPGYADLDRKRKTFSHLLAQLQVMSKASPVNKSGTGAGQTLVAAYLPEALEAVNVHREELTGSGLQFIRRKLADGKYYYLINHTAHAVDAFVPLQVQAGGAMIMDPQNGRYGVATTHTVNGRLQVKLQLLPGEALILRTYAGSKPSGEPWTYRGEPSGTQPINGVWELHFTAGGPELPADKKLTALISWTRLGDPKAVAFSGSAVYTTTFTMASLSESAYWLQLGSVNESAHVWINGKDAGIAWSIPFQLNVGQYLKTGVNTLKIEVANLMANRIRDMDRKGIQWRNYHEINFVNIQYKPFDASNWEPLSSGLLGPVTITSYTAANNN